MSIMENILLPEFQTILMLAPKGGTQSVKIALADGRKVLTGVKALDLYHFRRVEARDAVLEYPGYLRIAITRDPLTRLQSAYRDKVQSDFPNFHEYGITKKTSFEEFVEIVASIPDSLQCDMHFRSQSVTMCLPDLRPAFTHHYKVEDMPQAWTDISDLVEEKSGKRFHPIEHHHKSPPGDVEYTDRSRAMALERYADDIRIFGYGNTEESNKAA
jgi:hypothetical protein